MKNSNGSKFYISAILLGALSLSISSSNAYDRSALPSRKPFWPNASQQISNLGSKSGNTAMHAEGGVQFMNPQPIQNSPKVKLRELSVKAQNILRIIENNPALSAEANYLEHAIRTSAQVLYLNIENTNDSIDLLNRVLEEVKASAREKGINLDQDKIMLAPQPPLPAIPENQPQARPIAPDPTKLGGFSYWGENPPSAMMPGAAPQRPLPAIPAGPMATPPARPQGMPTYNSFSNLGNDQTQYPDVFQSHLGERSSPSMTPPARPMAPVPSYSYNDYNSRDR